ncbi:Ger(x)C family spore germination protein [Geomicrobium sp. JSM 1781026]|uniref:Ger(x)C family spore germination protein n=1 Tax=Geomicrobium sp. JSM 1781026 TaxID=3344580 RepID=UPI0035BFCB1B
MKFFTKLTICLLACLLLTSCWGAKEIQHQSYVTAIGIDYEDDEYVLYYEFLNYSTVAKSEAPGLGEGKSEIAIAQASGYTLEWIVGEIERAAATPISYSHINTVYLSPNALEKEHLNVVIDFLGRWPSVRYNTWLFASNASVEDTMANNSFFDRAPIYTFTFDPEEMLNNNSFISVTTLQELVQYYYEPTSTVLIPSINIDSETWRDENQPNDALAVDGGYFIAGQECKGFLSWEQLKGIDWFEAETRLLHVVLPDDRISAAIQDPTSKVEILANEDTPAFAVTITANADVFANPDEKPLRDIQKMLEDTIEEDIRRTFTYGVEMGADILHLTEKPFRFHPGLWSVEQLQNLEEDALQNVNIDVRIQTEGDYQ